MKDDQLKKNQKYQNMSLMALTSGNQAEPTKKTIEAEDLNNIQPISTSNNRKYMFQLPFSIEISSILTHLTTRFASLIIHAEEDRKGAQLILQGLKISGIRRFIAKMLDYTVFCCSRGFRFGALQQTYNVILITIRKQIIQNRCIVTVTNPYNRRDIQSLFVSNILDPIQEQLKNVSKSTDLSMQSEHQMINPYLSQSSPTQLQIQIHTKIYNLFILPQNKEFNRFKNIFMHSLQKITNQIQKHKQKTAALQSNAIATNSKSKKGWPNPATLIDIFNNQTAALMSCIRNSYKEEEHPGTSYLKSLVTSEIAQEIAYYTIEETLCFYQLNSLKEIYFSHTFEQCGAYNNQMDYLNKNCTNTECFDHLQLRQKYRLPNQSKPYYCAIQRLKTVQNCISLRQMLLVIQQTFSEVKTDCLTSHNGRVQLSSMDDLLPVMIYVTVRAGIRNFPVYVKLIDDYVRSKSVFELQQRVITTLYVAIQDISRSWEIKQKGEEK